MVTTKRHEHPAEPNIVIKILPPSIMHTTPATVSLPLSLNSSATRLSKHLYLYYMFLSNTLNYIFLHFFDRLWSRGKVASRFQGRNKVVSMSCPPGGHACTHIPHFCYNHFSLHHSLAVRKGRTRRYFTFYNFLLCKNYYIRYTQISY